MASFIFDKIVPNMILVPHFLRWKSMKAKKRSTVKLIPVVLWVELKGWRLALQSLLLHFYLTATLVHLYFVFRMEDSRSTPPPQLCPGPYASFHHPLISNTESRDSWQLDGNEWNGMVWGTANCRSPHQLCIHGSRNNSCCYNIYTQRVLP